MNKDDRGFTLVEVLVALAILVISLAVLLKIIATNLDRTRQVRNETTAASLLQSLLAQTGTSIPISVGDRQGVFPGGYGWQLHVEPYGDYAPGSTVAAMTVVATVRWQDDGRIYSRSLTTLRAVPVPVSQ
jgi:type II secretion system protein I